MDLDEAITIAQLDIEETRYYLMIGWLAKSFEIYLYSQDNLWRGKFSTKRLTGFSKNLNMSVETYYAKVKKCLSEQNENYCYELKGGFFYWKRKLKNRLIIEGFMPVELDSSLKTAKPDLIEVLLGINKQLRYKITGLRTKYDIVKTDYEKCLKDTEDFLNLKIDMERALCDRFLNTLHVQKSVNAALDFTDDQNNESNSKIMVKVVSREPVSNTTSILSMANELSKEASKLYIVDQLNVKDKMMQKDSMK